ncbi:MAG: hypothetical protein KC877_00830 [Candidatus Kaiserbacteria bacterium]|nr:hypothetical protein [Candidatus Kaiserbacteria bacterium]MCB9816833.1 hypothetical protein [Candidatus Nomurabacteria bacterium]
MSKTAVNLIIVLGLITVAFAGYYLYTQKSATTLDFDSNRPTFDNMIANTRAFIERGKVLDGVQMNVGLFDDERFTSLRSYRTDIVEPPIGRSDPFAEVEDKVFDELEPPASVPVITNI